MGFFDKLKKAKGGYIFLSHSHDDIEQVRLIRNRLEKDGFEPLCFYLKCLEDDDEIADLIKREIDAREWFIFVDSENARSSKWVTLEREYITETDRKKIITVELNDSRAVEEAIRKLSHNLRVFISCSGRDLALARRVQTKLEEKDYLVFGPDSISMKELVTGIIANAIQEASREGCVLALLTENAANSKSMQREIAYALEQGGNVVPVIVGDAKLDDTLNFLLCRHQAYFLPEDPGDDDLDSMIDRIGKYILQR